MTIDRGKILIWALATLATLSLAVGIALAFSGGSDRVVPEPSHVNYGIPQSVGGGSSGTVSPAERATTLPLPAPGLPAPTDVIRVPRPVLPEPTDVFEVPGPRLPEPLEPIDPRPQRSNR